MALIQCPKCGKTVSDTSEQCIYCGYNFKKAKLEAEIRKSFGNLTAEKQKQYESEFYSQNKRCRKFLKFRRNHMLSAIAITVGWLSLSTIIPFIQILNSIFSNQSELNFWVWAMMFALALLVLIGFIGVIFVFALIPKVRKCNVIYYAEFAKWLKENKQIELRHVFTEKEKIIYKTLYPKEKI